MGGFGSGRRFGKDCTDDRRALDARSLQRQRLLMPGNSLTWSWSRNGDIYSTINLLVDADRVTLRYQQRERGGGLQPMTYSARLDWTPCHFGGRRVWWLCPRCGRRVAVLYGGAVFACRHCHRLAYRCQREADHDRAARRADKLRARLGWKAGIFNGPGGKPAGMHWRTFERLRALHDAHAMRTLEGIAAKVLGGAGGRGARRAEMLSGEFPR